MPHNHVCTSHREPRGQAATGSTGPGRSHSLLFGGPVWQPAHPSPSTSPHPPEVGPPHTAAWVYVCVRRRVHVCGVRMKHCHLTSGYSEQGVLATLEHVNPPWKELTLRWRDREPDPDKNGCFSNKTRLQPEQRQAFKQKPSESWLSGSLSPPHSAGTEATPDLTLLSAPRRVKTLGGPQMSLACHRCGNEVPVC